MSKSRKLYNELVEHAGYKEFSIITGARQVGKTTLLKQLYSFLKSENKKTWFVTFENRGVLRQIDKDPENLFRYTARPENSLANESPERLFILIDEIQYAAEPTSFLKYLYDTYAPNLKIIATGSSAFYIDKKFKDSLAGRKRIFRLSGLNFEEFISFKGKDELIEEVKALRQRKEYISLRNGELMSLFDEYITYGGYPSVVLFDKEKDKINMLKEIKDSYVKKDMDDSNVENEDAFYNLLVILASQIGGLLNKNDLSNILRIHNNTIERYLYVIRKSFHIDLVKPFFSNLKKEIVKMPKVFFNDLGLRNLLVNNFSELTIRTDKGDLVENYVYLRLKEIYERENIRFWRTTDQNELDFVVKNKGLNAYEVKFNPAGINKKKYSKFQETYPEAIMQFICYQIADEPANIHVLKL